MNMINTELFYSLPTEFKTVYMFKLSSINNRLFRRLCKGILNADVPLEESLFCKAYARWMSGCYRKRESAICPFLT